MQSDNICECVKFAVNLMGHGHARNLNKWRYWDCAKRHKLCFCCLGEGHLGQLCNRTRVCGINDCKEVHHRLLHKPRNVVPSGHSRGIGVEKKEETNSMPLQQIVIGDMKATDWSMCAREWPHLQCLEFHKLGPRPTVDVLIGLDCADLHFSPLKTSEEHLDSQ